MNGIHNELNGGGENMALKDEVQHLHCPTFFWQLDFFARERLVLPSDVNKLMLSSLLR